MVLTKRLPDKMSILAKGLPTHQQQFQQVSSWHLHTPGSSPVSKAFLVSQLVSGKCRQLSDSGPLYRFAKGITEYPAPPCPMEMPETGGKADTERLFLKNLIGYSFFLEGGDFAFLPDCCSLPTWSTKFIQTSNKFLSHLIIGSNIGILRLLRPLTANY